MNLPSTYSSFLANVQHYKIGEADELIAESSKIGSFVNKFFNKVMPACYILDYTTGKYIYATSRMRDLIEHPLSYFLDGGIEFSTSLFHKKDLVVYGEKVLPENLAFLKSTPVEEHSDFLFQVNYRGKRKSGGYRNVVQESIFIKSAEDKMPLATLGFLYEVPGAGNESRINHKISRIHDDEMVAPKSIISNIYFSNEQDNLLTKREIEVLKYLCDDLTSEEIAGKLFISRHTVDNHRRKLLEKTNMKTSVGLVKFAIEAGYI